MKVQYVGKIVKYFEKVESVCVCHVDFVKQSLQFRQSCNINGESTFLYLKKAFHFNFSTITCEKVNRVYHIHNFTYPCLHRLLTAHILRKWYLKLKRMSGGICDHSLY